jgi:putative SOS response-associated peptidase YedK
MCGRYATTHSATDLSSIFDAIDATEDDESIAVDYNVAPTDPVPIIRMSASAAVAAEAAGSGASGRVLSVARWGLVPPWATDRRSGARMINARAETVATTRAFAKPFATRRCLVPAAGWYEFAPPAVTAPPKMKKQPYFMTPISGEPVVFGGLWSVWGGPDERLLTCSIVTTAAIGELTAVHDRMPLILSADRWDSWLTATTDLSELLMPPTEDQVAALEIRPVGLAVGDVRNDGPDLVRRLSDVASAPADLTLF